MVVSVLAVAGPPTGAKAEAETLPPVTAFDVLPACAFPAVAPVTTIAVAEACPEPTAAAFALALAVPALPVEPPVPPAPAVLVALEVTFVPASVDVMETAEVA